MAFVDIKDPIKREETVKDYIKNLKEIRERHENEKVRGISQRQDLTKLFQPVVQATEKSASKITNELKNLKEEKSENLKEEQSEPKPVNKAVEYYLNQFNKSKLDQYFGIYKENNIYMMGDKEIVVDDRNNIFLDNGAISFKGTKGLWNLIMFKSPELYYEEDLDNYKELLDRTNAINMPRKTSAADRPKGTAKWRFFKEKGITEDDTGEEIENEQDTGEEMKDEQDTDEEMEQEHGKEEKVETGTGVHFLPGDITGLIKQFHLLLAEFRAGNKSSTKNQIVAILDDLLRRNYLNQEEYNAVCRTLSC